MDIKIINNSLQVDNVIIFQFPYNIKDYLVFGDKIVILIESPIKSNFNENIFCITKYGKLIWKIDRVAHIYEDSPYDNVKKIDNYTFEAWNYDSNNYIVDIDTGKIVSCRFLK